MVKNLSASAGDTGDMGSIPRSGRSRGVGNGNPLQYSCLENSMDKGTWWATVHGVAKSQIRLSAHARARTHTHTHTHTPPPWGHKKSDTTECAHTHTPKPKDHSKYCLDES